MKTFWKASAALLLGTATIAAPSIATAQNSATANSVNDKRGYDALDAAQKTEYDAWPADYRTTYLGWPAEYQQEFWTYPVDYRTAYWAWPADYRTAYWAWPNNQRSSYWSWPADYQTFYWQMTPDQQSAWWALTDAQRGQIVALTPDQRVAALNSLHKQIAAETILGTTDGATSGTIMASSTTAQATPAARTGEYPICSGAIQDSCIQPREAGKNYGNVPLDYWPGKPASEK